MSDQPSLPAGDFNLPPGVSVRDIEDVVADARAAKGIETVADDEHHAMMNGPRIRQAMGLDCPHGRPKDDCGFCAANERAAGVVRMIECERVAAVQEFMDSVLGALKRMGIKTDDCDGEDAPEVVFSGWIYHQIEHARMMGKPMPVCEHEWRVSSDGPGTTIRYCVKCGVQR